MKLYRGWPPSRHPPLIPFWYILNPPSLSSVQGNRERCFPFAIKGDRTLEQALKTQDESGDRAQAGAHRIEEIIDAFDQVLESLDEILALTEHAFPRDLQGTDR